MVRLGSAVRFCSGAFCIVLYDTCFCRGGFGKSMAKKTAVELIALQCSECKRRNYTTSKNRKNIQGKLELKKYCPFDRKHTVHKETKIK